MINFTPEMIEKAKAAKSAEELLEIAKANGVEMTADEAATYFAQLNPKSGELDDDDLDNVAGGACESKKTGRIIVSSGTRCLTGHYELNASISEQEFHNANYRGSYLVRRDNIELRKTWCAFSSEHSCGWCTHLEFEGGKGVCGKS